MENQSSSECIAMPNKCTAMPNECIICLLNYTEETKKITECNHIFHQECLERWLQENTSCPLCRSELKPKNNVYSPINSLPLEQSRLSFELSNGVEALMDLLRQLD